MCLASIDNAKHVCALSTHSITPSVGSYVTARAAPTLSCVMSSLALPSPCQRATRMLLRTSLNLDLVSKQACHAYHLRLPHSPPAFTHAECLSV